MATEVKKKEGETLSAFIYRFSKKIKQSGVLREARKRRFRGRSVNRNKRRTSAIYRTRKAEEVRMQKKYGRFQ